MESYRARRSRLIPGENQSALPFSVADAAPVYTAEGPADPQAEDYRASLRTTARPRRPLPPAGGIEISAEQPQLDFTAPEEITAHPSDVLVPVADLNERLRAGALDAGFLALSYGFFLALFASLGGRFAFAKADVLIYGVTFVLLYAAYFGLFSVLGPATPGMTLCGLTVVNFEGHPAQFRNLLWRSFGYLLSGGSLFLGYMWSLWDEDHLTWQDRISQTYVTYAVRYISPSTSSSV